MSYRSGPSREERRGSDDRYADERRGGDDPYRAERHGSDSSVYSCSNLPEDDPYRRLKASEVRRQFADAPSKRYRMEPAEGSTSKKHVLSKYPKTCKNTEELNISMKSPWQEYPLSNVPGESFRQRETEKQNKPRLVYGHDRDKFDVVYHNPFKHDKYDRDLDLANYREAGYYSRK